MALIDLEQEGGLGAPDPQQQVDEKVECGMAGRCELLLRVVDVIT